MKKKVTKGDAKNGHCQNVKVFAKHMMQFNMLMRTFFNQTAPFRNSAAMLFSMVCRKVNIPPILCVSKLAVN